MMKYSKLSLSSETTVSRRSVLACTAVGAMAALGGWAFARRLSLEETAESRTWLSVGQLVGADDRASALALQLQGSEVEVRGYEFPNSKRSGDFDLYNRIPLPCGGCGLLHAPGVKLAVVGAGRTPAPLSRSTWSGRLRIAGEGEVILEVKPSA
jgi:hypothetical protein